MKSWHWLSVVLGMVLLFTPVQGLQADPTPSPAPSTDAEERSRAFASALRQVNLSEAQKEQIRAIRANTPDRKERAEKIMEALSPAQQEQLRTLLAQHTVAPTVDTHPTGGDVMVGDDPHVAKLMMDFWTRMLAHPELIDFHPDASVAALVAQMLQTTYVDPVTDTQMEKGIHHQVFYLLHAAHLPTDALDKLPLDHDLAREIFSWYSTRVNKDLLGWAEVEGVFEATHDSHSMLLPPSAVRGSDTTRYAGIGTSVELDESTHRMVVLEVAEDSPASRAGLEPGDQLLKVDGLPTGGMSTELITNLILGAADTKVMLTVGHAGAERQVTLTRAVLHPHTVSSRVLPGNIGYLRLRSFSADSATEVEAVLLKWKMAQVRGYILDLRNNGGGLVQTAVDICSLFLPSGFPVEAAVGRDHSNVELLKSKGPGDYAGKPMAILVNRYTASASEITAGCLSDYGKATLVGSRTYGKGTMQAVMKCVQNTVLTITIARWYTPKARCIERVGLSPDVEISGAPNLVGQPNDPQLERALEVVKAKLGP